MDIYVVTDFLKGLFGREEDDLLLHSLLEKMAIGMQQKWLEIGEHCDSNLVFHASKAHVSSLFGSVLLGHPQSSHAKTSCQWPFEGACKCSYKVTRVLLRLLSQCIGIMGSW